MPLRTLTLDDLQETVDKAPLYSKQNDALTLAAYRQSQTPESPPLRSGARAVLEGVTSPREVPVAKEGGPLEGMPKGLGDVARDMFLPGTRLGLGSEDKYNPVRAFTGGMRSLAGLLLGGIGSLDNAVKDATFAGLNSIFGASENQLERQASAQTPLPTISDVEGVWDSLTKGEYKPKNPSEAITAYVVSKLVPLAIIQAMGIPVGPAVYAAQAGTGVAGETLRQGGHPLIGTALELGTDVGLPVARQGLKAMQDAQKGARALSTRLSPLDRESAQAAERIGVDIPVGAQAPRSTAALLERGSSFVGGEEPYLAQARRIGEELEGAAVGSTRQGAPTVYSSGQEAGEALKEASTRVSSTSKFDAPYAAVEASEAAQKPLTKATIGKLRDVVKRARSSLQKLGSPHTPDALATLESTENKLASAYRHSRRVDLHQDAINPEVTQKSLIEERRTIRNAKAALSDDPRKARATRQARKALDKVEKEITAALDESIQSQLEPIDDAYRAHMENVEHGNLNKYKNADVTENLISDLKSPEKYNRLRESFKNDPEALKVLDRAAETLIQDQISSIFRSGEEGVLSFGEAARKLSNPSTFKKYEHLMGPDTKQRLQDVARVADRMSQYMQTIKLPKSFKAAGTFLRLGRLLSPKFWVGKYGAEEASNMMAKLMTDPEFLKEFARLSDEMSSTKTGALALRKAKEGAKFAAENVPPEGVTSAARALLDTIERHEQDKKEYEKVR